VKAGRTPSSAGSSGPEGGAAASARAALYQGEEAPRRRPVTPGPAGPSGLPPRHSLTPLHSVRSCDRPAAVCHRSYQRASERANQRPPPPPTGQQQASARPSPTPLNGPLQPRYSESDQLLGAFPAAQSCLPLLLAAKLVYHSLGIRTRLTSWLLLVKAPPAPPPEIDRVPQAALADVERPVGRSGVTVAFCQ
jgi:hypothetical protein